MSAADRAEALFEAVLQRRTAEDRAAFLDGTCGNDPALRARIEALLAAHEAPAGVLDVPPAGLPITDIYRPVTEAPGQAIGPYLLLQRIGEGGFGVVFMAQQEHPLRRQVALKIIKPGMDTAEVIARFEAERQALAMMDHRNIAKVIDAGATDSGRPFFVMELVKGVPITEFCDMDRLPPKNRLKLFVDVCHAIQHAHRKGIIHRDIKPSNVMVTLNDGVPEVKVIDFGVAKATARQLTEKTFFTAFGQMVGTPAYMSPEQAEMSGLDIDTRSDVYSLGVLLYELLTGTTPLEAGRLRDIGFAEMQRLIREEEAPRPSIRLSSLGDSATILASRRGLEAKRLVQFLAGDLDWVVMKALEKDRNRRYETPGNFAEEIDRYLCGKAILARPPSAAYKVRKLVQRNLAAVITVGAFLVLLTVATIVSTLLAIKYRRAVQTASELKTKAEQGELQTFVAHFQDRSNRYAESAKEYAQDEKHRAAFLRIAQLLGTVPSRIAAWRDHLIMRVLLAGQPTSPWDLPDKKGFDIDHIEFSADRRKILTATNDGTLQIRTIPSRKCLAQCQHPKLLPPPYLVSLGFAPGDRVAWMKNRDGLDLFDAATGERIGQTLVHPSGYTNLSHEFSRDGTRVVTWTWSIFERETPHEAECWLWDVATATRVAVLHGTKDRVNAIAFDSDGSHIIGICDSLLLVWSARDGKLLRQIGGFSERFTYFAASPSGRTLALIAPSGVHWFESQDPSRRPTSTHIERRNHDDQLHPYWAVGSEDLLNLHITSKADGSTVAILGARVGATDLLKFAPHAANGSLALTTDGEVYELVSGQRIVPAIGRRFADEARVFAINRRWLQTRDGVFDLDVDRPLQGGDQLVRIGTAGVGWTLSDSEFWPLPEEMDDIETKDVILWSELLACGRLDESDQFYGLTEAEWESRRRQFAASMARPGKFQFPGLDVNDRLYWLRNECRRNAALLDRLIAEEPVFRNYIDRAEHRRTLGDIVGSLNDQLEARSIAGPAAWRSISGSSAIEMAFQPGRPRSDYELLLQWLDRRRADGVDGEQDILRGLVLYRLERFADVIDQFAAIQPSEKRDDAENILLRAMARKRLGQTDAAAGDYNAAMAARAAHQMDGNESLLREAEALFDPD